MNHLLQISKIKAGALGIAGIASSATAIVRCGQKTFRLKQHGIGLITVFAIIAIATVLMTSPIEQIEAQSSRNSYTTQHGDEITALNLKDYSYEFNKSTLF